MSEELEKILEDIFPYGGTEYSYNNLKEDLDSDEINWLGGMAYCIQQVLYFESDDDDDSIIGKLKKEIYDQAVKEIADDLVSETGMFLTSFGDNHPDTD